jgi:hypothetical protein
MLSRSPKEARWQPLGDCPHKYYPFVAGLDPWAGNIVNNSTMSARRRWADSCALVAIEYAGKMAP